MHRKYTQLLQVIIPFLLLFTVSTSFSSYDQSLPESNVSLDYVSASPILITADDQFTGAGFSGTGTENDPYLLSGISISATQIGINIQNTRAHFRINDSLIDGTAATNGYGIYLYNVTNALINSVTITNFDNGGIYVQDGANSTLIHNDIDTSGNYGVSLFGTQRMNLTSNVIFSALLLGLKLQGSIFGVFDSNTISSNGQTQTGQYGGVRLDSYSYENMFFNNSIYDNWGHGLFFSGYNNSALNNKIYQNTEQGLFLGPNSITLDVENYNIGENTIYANGINGIYIASVDNSSIFLNTIYSNTIYGCFIGSGIGNEVTFNNFLNNNAGGIQGSDTGTENDIHDNYWFDWRAPDLDNNGIVDNPYLLNGAAANQDPFPRTDNLKLRFTSPFFTHPVNSEVISGQFLVTWMPALHSLGIGVTHTLYYSSDNGATWNLVADNLVDSYLWDTSTLPDETQYRLKIVAASNDNLTAESISDIFAIDNTSPTVTTTLPGQTEVTTTTDSYIDKTTIQRTTTLGGSTITDFVTITTASATFSSFFLIGIITTSVLKFFSRRKRAV